MASITIVDVSVPGELPGSLRGSHIDGPTPGAIVSGTSFDIFGWVIGVGAGAVAVEFIHTGKEQARSVGATPVAVSRPDVALAYPDTPEAGTAGFRGSVDASKLPPEFEIRARAILADGTRAALGAVRARREGAAAGAPAPQPAAPQSHSVPTVRPELGELIRGAASAYGAESLPASLANGGGPSEAQPQQPHAEEWRGALEQLDLGGRKVLDLGSGLGDASRAARALGAALVDGLEPDPRLVRLSRLVNAYERVSRVSFYHRDLASADTYAERYDVVLALHDFGRVRPVIGAIAAITDGVLLVRLPDEDEADALARVEVEFGVSRALPSAGPSEGRYAVAASSEDIFSDYLRDGAGERLGAGAQAASRSTGPEALS